ncbi:MAG: response regulator transcription factor [Planctomycetota bacterium]
MAKRTVLVVEDDAAIRRGVVDALKFAGYVVTEAADGERGLEAACAGCADLVLLDLMLPRKSGFDVLAELRASGSNVPVVILTARGMEADRVRGLEQGADDYVVKPFSAKELLARVEAVLRRSAERPEQVASVKVAGRSIDFERREVRLADGSHEELSERECELLQYMASNRARAVSREEILQRVWGLDPKGVETRTVDMHVARLREKLGDDPGAPEVIATVRGKGYRFG